MRPIDKSKKANIKCEHCGNWYSSEKNPIPFCLLSGETKDYWKRCKHFEWAKNLIYKEAENETDN